MAKPFREWTVLPHGKLTRLEDNLLSVVGVLRMPPMGEVERRMSVARLGDGRLIIYSAIALDETEMHKLEEFGTPAFLVVPNDIHRMDAKIWKDRYPALKVITPAGARRKVEGIVKVDGSEIELVDPAVQLVVVPGTDERELAMLVDAGGATTLVINDLIFNLPNRPGLSGWLFKTIGMTGDQPRLPAVIKKREVSDARALSAQFERWSHLNLKRILVAHGNAITDQPAQVLRRIAGELSN
jgi:hypothetical protein